MRLTLRWRILLFSILPPLVLTAAAFLAVNRNLTDQVRSETHENLKRASLVFERLLGARAAKLTTAAQVMVRDPRFFSVLAIAGSSKDPHFCATVERVSRDFNEITHADIFQVVDRRGRLLATVGHAAPSAGAREAVLAEALAGRQVAGILVEGTRQFQVTVMPVRVERSVQGALILGAAIGPSLAHELHVLTQSEVTFLSNGMVTGSSFSEQAIQRNVLAALARQPDFSSLATSGRSFGTRTGPNRSGAADGVVELPSASGTFLTLARGIPESGNLGGQVYVLQRSLDEETAVLRQAQTRLLRLGSLAALAAFLAGIAIAESITRPVQQLVRGAEEMARGNYEYALEPQGHDEIGYLAGRFEEMRQHERAYVLSLQQAARVKSEFITLASHELRTPISVIKAYHDLFMSEGLGPISVEQRRALEAIDRSVQGLVQLAKDATDMAAMEEGWAPLNRSLCDLAMILERANAAVLAEAQGRRVQVTLDVAAEIGAVHVDGGRVSQVISNLVRNGIRFTPDGGQVNVVARRADDDLVIDVRDNGIGIAEERQAELFEHPCMVRDSRHHHSSRTLEFNSGGLGMGLPIAHSLVLAHGGTLTVSSSPNNGSTFSVRLPLDELQFKAAA